MRGLDQGSRLTRIIRHQHVRKGGCAFVTFHRVWDSDNPANDTGMPQSEFESILDKLEGHFTFLTAKDAFSRARSASLPRNGLALTVDDGYADMSSIIAPMLIRRNLPATFFVASNMIDSSEGLSTDQLKDLADEKLFEIGGHSKSHLSLSALAPSQQFEEIRSNKTELETCIGKPVVSFSYPFGRRIDLDNSTVQAVKRCGYWGACTTENLQIPAVGVLSSRSNPYLTNRVATNRIEPAELCRALETLLAL